MTSHFHGHFTTMKLKGVQSVDGIHKIHKIYQNLQFWPSCWCDVMICDMQRDVMRGGPLL